MIYNDDYFEPVPVNQEIHIHVPTFHYKKHNAKIPLKEPYKQKNFLMKPQWRLISRRKTLTQSGFF